MFLQSSLWEYLPLISNSIETNCRNMGGKGVTPAGRLLKASNLGGWLAVVSGSAEVVWVAGGSELGEYPRLHCRFSSKEQVRVV